MSDDSGDSVIDYPAAHSMDSAWFAVDRDGRVAYFSTGEAGAMPEDAADSDALDEALRALPARGEEIVEPYRRLPSEGGAADPPHEALHYVTDERSTSITLLLADPAPVREDLEAGRARLYRAAVGCAVHYRELSLATSKRLHDAGLCRGCFLDYRSYATGDDDDDGGGGGTGGSLAMRGIYVYSHTCENWISGPYGREAAPTAPISVEDLPPEVRADLVRLPVSFRDDPYIQPAEHVPCASWEAAWLETDGRHVHAFDGQEAEVARLYGEGGDFADQGLIFVPDDDDDDGDDDGDA
jgi:hypothetical protein